jgi:hypothetical protein
VLLLLPAPDYRCGRINHLPEIAHSDPTPLELGIPFGTHPGIRSEQVKPGFLTTDYTDFTEDWFIHDFVRISLNR